MNPPESTGRLRRRGNRLPTIVAGIGLLIIGGSACSRTYLARTAQPGKLVARNKLVTWRSPVEEVFRVLSTDAASAKFEVENVGGAPVHVVAVETTCGCVSSSVKPEIIPPGTIAAVEVRATPLQVGEKTVSITLRTDSPATPKVELQLHIVGSRCPPFFATAGGELSFLDGFSLAETRELLAYNVEMVNAKPTPPLVKVDLPFLEIGPAKLLEESRSPGPGSCNRKYGYELKMTAAPPTDRYAGEVTVTDPWDSRHVERIRFHGENRPPIRTVPSRITLRIPNRDGQGAEAKLLVMAKESVTDLLVEVEGGGKPPLNVERVSSSLGEKLTTYSIALRPGAAREGDYNLLVGRSSSPDRLTVPVAVRFEEAR